MENGEKKKKDMMGFDLVELLRRIIKYLMEGIAVGLAVYFFMHKKRPSLSEILMIAFSAAATFALLDLYSPSIGVAARTGSGFGIGAGLVGFPGAMM